jgi:hypothetical protein
MLLKDKAQLLKIKTLQMESGTSDLTMELSNS